MNYITNISGNKLEIATTGSAGVDIRSSESVIINCGEFKLVPTGTFSNLAKGYMLEVRGRSGYAAKGVITHVGTIDSDYEGEIKVILWNMGKAPLHIKPGDRVAQLILQKTFNEDLRVSDEKTYAGLPRQAASNRGSGGFGSTGVK